MKTALVRTGLATAISASLALGSQVASAQLEEVLVTAQKREQSLLDVPISIATLEGERFTALFEGGADIRALSTRVPGLYVESSNGRVAPRFYIRGLGNIDFDLAASQPVTVVMDEIIKENVVLKSFPLFDIERVEVLRGPQGSLFGRNTTAGIVKFDSYKPTQDMEGRAKLDVGTLGTLNFEGAIGGGNELVQARGAVLYQNRDDYIDNGFTGEDDALGGFEEKAVKGFLSFTPNDAVSVLLGAHYRDLDGTASVFRANILTTGSNSLNENYDRETVLFDGGDNNPQLYENTGVNLRMDFDVGPVTLTSITAWEDAEGSSLGDIDGGFGAAFLPDSGPGFIPFPSETQDSADTQQITQEFRLTSNSNGNLFWQTGLFFFDSELDVETDPGFVPPTEVNHENTAWAIFGQLDYTIADAWILTAGLRYTDDEKTLTAPFFKEKVEDDYVSGNLSLAWNVADTTTLWAKVATGFRAPTIQGRDIAFGGAPSIADSETSTSFEVGAKSQFWDDRARINAAAFYYEVEDQQFTAVGGTGNNIQLVNADKGVGTGFEVDFEILPTSWLELTAGYAYVKTEIKDNNLFVPVCGSGQCTPTDPTFALADGTVVAEVNGNAFPNAPESTLSFTAKLFFPVGDNGEVFAFTDWAWQGDTQIFLYETVEYQTDSQFEGGLRLGYRRQDLGFEVALFGRNITDEDNLQGGIDFNNNTGFVNEPQVWGLSLSTMF